MRRRAVRSLLVAVFVAAVPVGALAQDDTVACDEAVTQADMTRCAAQDYEKADAALNALWPEVVERARSRDEAMAAVREDRDTASTVETLRAAQRAWIAFRDAQCELEGYAALGGSMQPMVVNLCRTRLTRERIETLDTVLKTEGP